MTVKELYLSVAHLGFEYSLEDGNGFCFAANRALLEINSLRPKKKTCLINHFPQENEIKNASFAPIKRTSELCFEASNVKSYYFEVDGKFDLHVERFENGAWETLLDMDGENKGFTAKRGFIKDGGNYVEGRVRLRFTGDYAYFIRNVAMYSDIFSDDEKDIPAFSQYSRYDISLLADDFLSFDTPPVLTGKSRAYLNQDYGIENDRVLLLPYDAKGVYEVTYNSKPQTITADIDPFENKTSIELDADLEALLPLLVASYVWLEDEPEKAQYYFSMYRERTIEIERKNRNNSPCAVEDVYGWS